MINYNGILALEDGSVYQGFSFGASKTVVGEAVFNTSITGYQEILTDPSYFGQIVTMTAPQIGNYGVNAEDIESETPKVSGFVVRDISPVASNWRSKQELPDYLIQNDIVAISGVDTRAITKKLRVNGAMKCCLSSQNIPPDQAVQRAQKCPGLVGIDYAKKVTCKTPFLWETDHKDSKPFTVKGTSLQTIPPKKKSFTIVAYDFGAKNTIFKRLCYHGFKVHVVPANTPAEAVREIDPDGLFLSNGPGDPSAPTYAHKAISKLIQHYPTFGICFGHQIITHALHAETIKLKFGHRGSNQPVKNLETGTVAITSQNHGFVSTAQSLEKHGAIVTEINLNDNTVEGLRHKDLPVFSVQYHPEASPGPHDTDTLFDQFYQTLS
jgi:carbamoyl-phosphate synthase small subunit